jgi:hypothetical protein
MPDSGRKRKNMKVWQKDGTAGLCSADPSDKDGQTYRPRKVVAGNARYLDLKEKVLATPLFPYRKNCILKETKKP